MKKICLLFLMIFVMQSILAININVEKESLNEVMVRGLKQPVVFDLKIKNLGETDSFYFYNLLGFEMYPVGTVLIENGETKDVQLKISPIGEFNHLGSYTFEYFIRGRDNSEKKERLTFNIVEIKDAFETGSNSIDPELNSLSIYVRNKLNFDFKNINAEFKSAFFDFKKTFDLQPYDKKEFSVELNKNDFKKLTAGFYTLNADIAVDGEKTNLKGTIKFEEKKIVTTTTRDEGILINTKVIKKVNEGNTLGKSETVIEKNIISRLFTTFSPDPDTVEREGTSVYYTWAREIKPGESFEVTIKTNWIFLLVTVLLIVTIVLLTKNYTKTNLILKKKVSFVKTKGGEFALKVTLLVNAKKYIERVNVVDRIPPLVKIHEKFWGEKPSRIDEKTRRIEWSFEKLEPGEIRVLSYIIYSQVGVLGKFALPPATAIYDKEGKIQESESNRAFFIAEHRKGDIEEE